MNKPRLDDPATWTAEDHLYHLFLFHAAKELDQTIQTCVKENRDHRDFLVRLLDVERVGRYESRVKRLIFFQVISKRADTGSVILTTNKAFKDWGEVFQDNAVATANAERLIEHGDVIKIEGSSYRVKQRRQKSLGLDGSQDKK